ncbi:DUF1801 domain-containing protein [Myxococcus sp. K15C18031901]|uniref:DUF1801 domain-containing protein n=1 Tax=Myxococcus dinghuensis TaxID=2906761 RepID=UPI0020A71D77|nr:DUF1801 domain-containing protein [Myxococcus dinghuensis]MCP3097881.1 DUF1801 domain-containing protein [Myxococcus dinghuensis]
MPGQTTKKSAKVAKKAVAKRAVRKAPKVAASRSATTRRKAPKAAGGAVLLSGGNPQIAKGYGDTPVQAYIAAMPGWKRDVGLRLDALISAAVPGVSKAVKWNSPLYGVEGQGWFLGIHCFAKYIKVAFFRGTSLRPVPPGESKSQDTRYLDIREDTSLDAARFTAWVKQASRLPGERM